MNYLIGYDPGGRPKVVAEVKELAREHTSTAIETLVSIMTNTKAAPAANGSYLTTPPGI